MAKSTPTEQDIRTAVIEGDEQAVAQWLRDALAQRDTAWGELRSIRNALGANPEESTYDEVQRVLAGKDKEIQRLHELCERLQQQAEIHAQEARTANATINEIYQSCTGATGEPGNWNGAEPVRRIINELREVKQALRDVRPEIDSLIAGLYRSHVEPSSGIVHDEDVAHEISQLTELHERIVRLIGDHRPETEDDENRRYARMLDRVHTATPPPEGEQWEYYYKRKDCPARYATDPRCICWHPEGAGPRPNERHDDAVPAVEWRKASAHRSLGDTPHTPQQAHGDALAALDRTQYRRWKDRGGARGYVCGDVPVALLVQVIEDYRRLTASGVPYVPEEVRRLPEWMRRHAIATPECADELERALASAPAVPSGYKLVPVEPTGEMLRDGAKAVRDFLSEKGEYPRSRAMWKAMIAAAPSDGGE